MAGFYQMGLPLNVDGVLYKSKNDRPKEQEEYVVDF